jgi:uncharacterized Tic20 family protein
MTNNDSANKDSRWLNFVATQYAIFGTITGLEATSLSVFVADLQSAPLKIIFTITCVFLLLQLIILVWIVNQERKLAYDRTQMIDFQKKEESYRISLIIIMVINWGLILSMMILKAWGG